MAVGSHAWSVSTEQGFASVRKTDWERRDGEPDRESGGCQGQGRDGDGKLRLEKIGLCERKPSFRGFLAHKRP